MLQQAYGLQFMLHVALQAEYTPHTLLQMHYIGQLQLYRPVSNTVPRLNTKAVH